MDPLELSILCVAAFATSMLSAVIGMAGGITLLAVMLLFLEPLAAIPLHGVIQLLSNGSRALIQREHVARGILFRYAIPLLPMGFVGLAIAQALPSEGIRLLIGVFVLVATWAPSRLLFGTNPEHLAPGRRFLLLGAVVGVLSITVGATGPLIAPFFLDMGLTRQGIVGTKAACQTLGHLAKIAVFGVAGFAFAAYLGPLLLLGAMVVIGTWIGSRMLENVSELWFTRLYKGILTLIAIRLVLWDGARLLGWS